LKLENVLFETKAKTKIKVVDFGISGMCKGNLHDRNDAGTLRYMAPETLTDAVTNANPAIDIWAIGVMLYCMVFDKFPFNGENA
jgi:MAP/microtubule affinity-regulating kinase